MSFAWIALVAVALAGKAPPPKSLMKDKIDLNGDGKADKIEVLSNEGQGGLQAIKIVINGIALTDVQMYKEVSISVLDVDAEAKGQQLLVEGTSESGKRWFTFFIWDGKKLHQAMKMDTGAPNGQVKLLGEGQVLVEKPKSFFVDRSSWILRGYKFEELVQPYVWVGSPATIQSPVVIVYTPDMRTPVATLEGGAQVDIVLASKDDKPWYLVRTAEGFLGWLEGAEIGKAVIPGSPVPDEG